MAVLPLFDVEAVYSLLNSRSLADKARLQLSVSVPHASAWIWTAPLPEWWLGVNPSLLWNTNGLIL